jgi:hypothetical protein
MEFSGVLRKMLNLAWIALAMASTGCAMRDPAVARLSPEVNKGDVVEVARFSRRAEGESIPAYWEKFRIPLKTDTRYRFVMTDAGAGLEATAERSASALQRRVMIDPAEHAEIEWRWRVDQPVAGADKRRADREDSAARLIVAFEGDAGKLDFEERMTMRMAKALTGREMPYATLMYVWSNHHPAETIIPNPRTGRVQMIVVEGGPETVGRWAQFRRNVVEDYRRAFGEEPGRIVAVGVMTDADNTQESARCVYGDISFRRAPAQTLTLN